MNLDPGGLRSQPLLRLTILAMALGWCHPLSGAPMQDLTEWSIEDLMSIEVTSVSGKGQSLSDSAAAIFVITRDDIERSGATSVPDLLRMVPGLSVARIDSNKWAVNSRAPNSRFANKLLVMIDGRTVYTNTFSGVYWEVQDVLLEDLDRIEVIRGPGATLWGANAVNGVINIITRHTSETQGTYVGAGAGSLEEGFVEFRKGFSIGDSSRGRFYARTFSRGEMEFQNGGDAGDDWDMWRTGFRIDLQGGPETSTTIQADLYGGSINQEALLETLTSPYLDQVSDTVDVAGGNLLARFHRVNSPTSELTVQAYFDYTDRDESFIAEERRTIDLRFQRRWRGIANHDIIWGGRTNSSDDEFENSEWVQLVPDERKSKLHSVFLQDEITITDSRLWLTVGTKLAYHEYTDLEVQPSIRLLWAPAANHRVWAAVSRAVRTPSRLESDGRFVTVVIPPSQSTMGLPVMATFNTDGRFKSEVMIAYEMGYRLTFGGRSSLDLAAFYNDYDKERVALVEDFQFQGTHFESRSFFRNTSQARSYGVELGLACAVTDRWQLDLAYSYLDSSADYVADEPEHQVSVRSAFDLGDRLSLDVWLRYVAEARGVHAHLAQGYFETDEYTAADVRLAWRPSSKVTLSLVGQNLFGAGHLEFAQEKFTHLTETQPSAYGKVEVRF